MTNGWIEGELAAGNGPIATVKLFRTITKTIFGNFATQFKLTSSGIRIGFITCKYLFLYVIIVYFYVIMFTIE